jgi:hypothetical protein
MSLHCGPKEVDWVRNWTKNQRDGVPGLLLVGVSNPNSRSQAICAALLRNYTDARVMPLNSVLALAERSSGEVLTPSCLLIPNLYVTGSSVGASLPAWKVQSLYDALLARTVRSKPTVVYVEDMAGLVGAYGKPFGDFLDSFVKVVG